MRKRNNRYDFNDILNEQDTTELTEQDFFTTSDNRCLKSYIEDINGGDNFCDYCKYIFNLLEEEGYYD